MFHKFYIDHTLLKIPNTKNNVHNQQGNQMELLDLVKTINDKADNFIGMA